MLKREEYRGYSAIHYSLLSKLSYSPSSVLSEEKDFSDGILFGDILDILLTQGEEEFEKKYILNSIKRPTGQLGDFIDEYFKLGSFEIAYQNVGIKRDSIQKMIERFEEDGKEYYDLLLEIKNTGKTLISYDFYMKVKATAENLKNHTFTKKYFDKNSKYKILFQVPLLFKVDDIECKCLLDLLIIDDENKKIYPLDLKSTGDYVNNFKSNFIKWNYYLQASFYTEGVIQNYPDYSVDNFKFIVISSLEINKPLIYKCSDNDLLCGKKGGKLLPFNKKIKGYEELIRDYKWHIENDLWEYPREIYENEGEVELDIFEYEFKKTTYEKEQLD